MAELATIARPYAEALFKAGGAGDIAALAGEVETYAKLADHPDLRLLADNPKVSAAQMFDVITSVARAQMPSETSKPASNASQNFLRVVIENGRLAALPEIAAVSCARQRAFRRVRRGGLQRVCYRAGTAG